MAKTNRTKTFTFVLRVWLEAENDGEHSWRGVILQPLTEAQRHFCGPEELLAHIESALKLPKNSDQGD